MAREKGSFVRLFNVFLLGILVGLLIAYVSGGIVVVVVR